MRIGTRLQDVRLERVPGLGIKELPDVGPYIGCCPPRASGKRGAGTRETGTRGSAARRARAAPHPPHSRARRRSTASGTSDHAPGVRVRSFHPSARRARDGAAETSLEIRSIVRLAGSRGSPSISRPPSISPRRLPGRRRGGPTAHGALPATRSHARESSALFMNRQPRVRDARETQGAAATQSCL